jgi:hypothetical protein
MNPVYPDGLPRGLHSGRKYQLVSPLMRSELSSGRARQRRKFTSVPEATSVTWLFTDSEGQAFEAWWRDVLIDGSLWFECPLDHPIGYGLYTCRFTGVYEGPSRVGPDLWTYSAELELRERAALPPGWGEFPEFILDADIFDYAMNREGPLNQWQIYIEVMDTAINEDWPQP